MRILILVLLFTSCGKYSPNANTNSVVDTRSEVKVETDPQEVNITGEVQSITSLDTILEACGVKTSTGVVVNYQQWTYQQECLDNFKIGVEL